MKIVNYGGGLKWSIKLRLASADRRSFKRRAEAVIHAEVVVSLNGVVVSDQAGFRNARLALRLG